MSLQEKEIKIKEIELELLKLKDDQEIDHTLQIQDLENTKAKIEAEAYQDISAYDRVNGKILKRGNHCIAVPDEKAQTATVTATQG